MSGARELRVAKYAEGREKLSRVISTSTGQW